MNRINQNIDELIQNIRISNCQLIVLSNYFTSKNDPVRYVHHNSNDFSYIKNWYNSINYLKIQAIIFHDGLSQNFIDKYEITNIKFVYCELGKFSLNDERFFIFEEFISLLPEGIFVLTTDINDVVVNKYPLQLLKTSPEKLFVGRGNRRSWKSGIWTLKALKRFHDKLNKSIPVSFLNYPVFNPGTIGGRKDQIMGLLKKMNALFEKLGDDKNYDMPVFNYILKEYYFPHSGLWDGTIPFSLVWTYFYIKYRVQRKLERNYKKDSYELASPLESVVHNETIYAGFPFVSMFGWYENPSEAYLIHK